MSDNAALDPWISGAALLVLAVIGIVIRRHFESKAPDGPPPSGGSPGEPKGAEGPGPEAPPAGPEERDSA